MGRFLEMSKKKSDTQIERFVQVARDLECDEDEKAFEDKLRRVEKAKKDKPDGPSQKKGS